MFTSDHGEQMGDHWMKGKTGYFDQTFHVPLIVRDPRAEADAHRGPVNQSIVVVFFRREPARER